jgi:beta-lactamase class A
MASVVKLPIALEVLRQVADGRLTLDREVWLTSSDIRPCCTLERRHPNGSVSRTVEQLLTLAMTESDNTAADALLKIVGGPATVERRLRMWGFTTINVDRSEGQLLLDMAGVTGAPPEASWTVALQRRLVAAVDRDSLAIGRERYLADPRDTATPYETALLLGRLHLNNLLPPTETSFLLDLMRQTKTGARRIKGRLPADTPVAHKTGTTAIVINDVGIVALPPDSRVPGHLVLAIYLADGSSIRAMETTIARLSAAAFEFFSGRTLQRPAPPKRTARPRTRRTN